MNYFWCKGYRFGLSSCRLLTEVDPGPMPGWKFYNLGNWVEPGQWKNGGRQWGGSHRCYEKMSDGGTYPFIIE